MFSTTTVRRIFLIGLLLLLSASQAEPVSAGINVWTSNGPGGRTVYALAIDPSMPTTVYAGTPGGVFKSTDGGGSWIVFKKNLPSTIVNSLVIDPLTPATLYAGTYDGGVFKSTDGGGNWSAANIGLTGSNVRDLAIDPLTPATLYAGTQWGGVFKSTNGGGIWSTANIGLTSTSVGHLAIDLKTPSTLYVGTDSGGLFKSTNGGENWSAVNNGLPAAARTSIFSLAIDPKTPTTLYVGTFSVDQAGTGSAGFFKSTDGGGNWNTANRGLEGYWTGDLVIDPAASATLYVGTLEGGVFKSTNGGESWSAAGLSGGVVSALAIDPATPSTLYAGLNFCEDCSSFAGLAGVFKSTNSGGTWSAVNTGLPDADVRSLAIDLAAPATLYAGTFGGGVFKSTNSGGTWSAASTGLPVHSVGSEVLALAIDPLTPTTLFAAVFSCSPGICSQGVFKSTDGGGNWSATSLTGGVGTLAIDPKTPTTLYAGTYGGVFKSIDGGENWSAASIGLPVNASVHTLAIDPVKPTTLYVGTLTANGSYGGVYKSTNGGGKWSPASTGLDDPGVTLGEINSLVIDPATSATLYVGAAYCLDLVCGFGRVFKSTDGGGNWSAVNTGLPGSGVNALAIDPSMPAILYAGTDGGVFISTNGGEKWKAFNDGLTSPLVGSLAIDPTTPTTLYAGTPGGVFAFQRGPAELTINYSRGAPGSTFTLTGSNFPPHQTAAIAINGKVLGPVVTDSVGGFVFYLITHPNAEVGLYQVSACVNLNCRAMAQFTLDAAEVVRPQEGSGTTFVLPDGIAYHHAVYFPLNVK